MCIQRAIGLLKGKEQMLVEEFMESWQNALPLGVTPKLAMLKVPILYDGLNDLTS